jgi:hypothetical protein
VRTVLGGGVGPLRVTASCHSDDYRVEIKSFDATPWFEQADDETLLNLYEEEFGGDYSADEVARFCSDTSGEVEALFTYLEIVNENRGAGRDAIGFECYVDEDQARAWLQLHRPSVWAEIARRDEG